MMITKAPKAEASGVVVMRREANEVGARGSWGKYLLVGTISDWTGKGPG